MIAAIALGTLKPELVNREAYLSRGRVLTVARVLSPELVLAHAEDLVLVIGPALLCLRWLHSERSFTYSYDPRSEIPSDVLQRVADRERQRVELATAKEVQRAIMPRIPEQIRGLRVAHAYLPASEIGGDFYDVQALDEHRVAFALGDVAGHGISSGLVMSTVRGALRVHFRCIPDVDEVFESINDMLFQLADRRLLTTLIYGIYDSRTGAVQFGVSGHVVWCLRRSGRLESWEPRIFPLGARPQMTVEVMETFLEEGDTLVLLSDGLVEAGGGPQGEPFGYQRLEDTLKRMQGAATGDLMAGLLAEVARFTSGRDLDDDCTALVLQASPSALSGSESTAESDVT